MAEQALSDVKVLDLTRLIAGPYCTKLLGDYGAEVIKIEQMGAGDPARRIGPFPQDEPHPEKSGIFLHLNTNKRGITLNLKSETGRALFRELVRDADILVESFSPRVMPSLGFDYESLEKINPRLVVASISNFGQTGPYRDFKSSDLITYAMGGPMSSTGLPDRSPIRLGPYVNLYQAGATAAVAIMMSFYGAEASGRGEHVDISLMEAEMSNIDRRPTMLLQYQYTGHISQRVPTGERFASGTSPCRDGYVELRGEYPHTAKMAALLNMPELRQHPDINDAMRQTKPDAIEAFKAILIPWTIERNKHDVWRMAQENRIISSIIATMEDVVTDPHFAARGTFPDIEHPVAGTFKYPGAPFRAETPWKLRRPAPLLGQHNEEVYGALGYTGTDLIKLREQGVI